MSEKKVGKRLLTWVLVLVMTLSLLPLNVLAAEGDVAVQSVDAEYGLDPYGPVDYFKKDWAKWRPVYWGFDTNSEIKNSSLITTVTAGSGNNVLYADGIVDARTALRAATASTNDAVTNNFQVRAAEGYYVSRYRIVCGNHYSCGVERYEDGTPINQGGNYTSEVTIPVTSDKFKHNSLSRNYPAEAPNPDNFLNYMYNSDGLNTYYPYYLLIEVKEDTARYQADYSWGNLTSTLQSFSVPQSHTDLKRSAEFNARTPSDEALAAARAAGYKFAGWEISGTGYTSGNVVQPDGKVSIRGGDLTLTAKWILKTFTVTWKSQDGNTTYETDTDVAYDSAPSFDTTEPTKVEDAQYAYEFAGWSTTMGAESGKSVDELDKVTSNITYYAAFSKTPKTFTVTWKSQDGNDTYESDSGLAYNSTPSFDAADPTKADDAQYTYTFVGWSTSMNSETGSSVADLPNVTTNVTYYAAFSKTPKTFTVTWVNWNGDLLEKDEDVKYNSTPSYDGKTPTRPASGRYTYTFNGWTPALSPVTDDITYTATYKSTYHRPSTPSKPTVEIPDDDALGLNTTDHFAYIVGYGNGEVRPQNNITRAEVATIFFRLLTDDVRDENLTKTNRYSDVTRADWYNTAVSTLSSMGIITGYPDGTFRPNAAITRAEFAAIAARFDNDGDKTAAKFSDIATHWAKDEISIAYNNGWITGYPDGTFGPQRDITRAETMTLVNRVLNRQPETEDDLLPNMTVWTDNANPNAWYYLAVQEATNSHYYKFKTNSKYEKWTELRETRDWTLLEK